MKLVTNKTKHGIYCNGVMLVPGTNCLDEFDEENVAAKAFIEEESIDVKDSKKMTKKEKENAVANANTHATLDTLQKTFRDVDTSKQKSKLDKFDADIKKAEEGK